MINFGFLILASEEAVNAISNIAEIYDQFVHSSFFHSNFINVAIAFIFLGWVINKYNLLGGLDATQKKIIEDLDNAVKNKDKAIEELKTAETKLANAKNEADQIIKNAEKAAMQIRDEIIKDAEQEAVRIIDHAKKVIETEQEVAKTDLQNKLTAAAVEVARDNIKNSLNDDWHKQIISDFVENIPNVKVK